MISDEKKGREPPSARDGAEDSSSAIGHGIDTKIQRSLGDMLRQHYGDLVAEPMPEKIKRLWEQLEKKGPRDAGQ